MVRMVQRSPPAAIMISLSTGLEHKLSRLSQRKEVNIVMAGKYSRGAQKSVRSAVRREERGTLRSGSGKKVTSRKQAIAIGLSEARKKGARVPRKFEAGVNVCLSRGIQQTRFRQLIYSQAGAMWKLCGNLFGFFVLLPLCATESSGVCSSCC